MLNESPVHDLMQGGPIHRLLGAFVFYSNRLANGGTIQGAGTGTSDSVTAMANGQPIAVSNGEFRVPAAVLQALDRDFFDDLEQRYHQLTGEARGAAAARTEVAVATDKSGVAGKRGAAPPVGTKSKTPC